MNQQKFWPVKKESIIFHCSSYGSRSTDIAVPAQTELEFKIFHGTGGQSFNFSVGLILDFDSHHIAASAPRGLDFESHAGFAWQLPLAPELERDPSKPPDFPGFGGGPSPYFREGLTVKLFRPGEQSPIKVWDFGNEAVRGERDFTFPETMLNGNHVFVNPELMRRHGWWRVVVSHKSPVPAHIFFWSKSFLKNADIKTTTLTYRWLNHAFATVLGLLTPRASIDGHHITAGILEEVSSAIGKEPISFEDDRDELIGHMELVSVSTAATRGSSMKAHLQGVRDSLGALSDEDNRFWDNRLASIRDDDLVVKIGAVFSNPHLTFSKSLVSGDIIFHDYPVIYVAFPNVGPPVCYVNLNYRVRNLSPEEHVLFRVFAPDEHALLFSLNKLISKAIIGNYELIREYMILALGKAAAKGANIDSFRATPEGWELSYYDYILPDPNFVPQASSIHTVNVSILSGSASGGTSTAGVENVAIDHAPPDPGFGVFPDDFRVTDDGSLARLDKLKTIFVIMMENRSFDHFLGFLSREGAPSHGDRYITFPDNFTNPGAGNFVGPLRPIKASQIGFTTLLETPISPEHEYDHVLKQISDGFGTKEKIGAMQGFTLNILERFNETEIRRFESPQMAMTFYGKDELPMYFFLANNFKVLDQWFCAHPGPTWPNRIATVTGRLIALRNFELNDERIGYFREPTIFETLTRHGIDWRYLESNVSILRLFDLYRTDDKHVVPLRENDPFTLSENQMSDHDLSGLELLLRQNELPRVVFIDPRFSDAPPIRKANDDLAPANIGNGQRFIRDVCERLFKSQHWKDSALLITYDEHGGFFDHVPPPGTRFSDITGIEKIHSDPDSPDFLGVRVPTFLISPYVLGHSVSHTVFDHTSILKTILVHNRKKIPRDVFGLFGERVKKAAHFGMALDLDTPRAAPTIPALYGEDALRAVPSGISSFYAPGDPAENNEFHEALRTVFMPRNNA